MRRSTKPTGKIFSVPLPTARSSPRAHSARTLLHSNTPTPPLHEILKTILQTSLVIYGPTAFSVIPQRNLPTQLPTLTGTKITPSTSVRFLSPSLHTLARRIRASSKTTQRNPVWIQLYYACWGNGGGERQQTGRDAQVTADEYGHWDASHSNRFKKDVVHLERLRGHAGIPRKQDLGQLAGGEPLISKHHINPIATATELLELRCLSELRRCNQCRMLRDLALVGRLLGFSARPGRHSIIEVLRAHSEDTLVPGSHLWLLFIVEFIGFSGS